ncbi:MAG: hypothetical protein JSR82_10345 [Verrucomicrobia bacterium]|nr:hypothetical protein [Verrucomicrobiota bacterium]
MSFFRLLAPLALLLLSSCSAVLGPIVSESRSVSRVGNVGRTLTVGRALSFDSRAGGTRTIAFPPGTYVLEAEDASYWYFRAPAPLQFSELSTENWMPRAQLGGLMIAKGPNPFPGGGYIDGSSSSKILVWKLGPELSALEGRAWRKNF